MNTAIQKDSLQPEKVISLLDVKISYFEVQTSHFFNISTWDEFQSFHDVLGVEEDKQIDLGKFVFLCLNTTKLSEIKLSTKLVFDDASDAISRNGYEIAKSLLFTNIESDSSAGHQFNVAYFLKK